VTYIAAPAPSRRATKKPSRVVVALAATACVAAGSGGYFLLAGSSSSGKSAAAPAAPVVHHPTARTPAVVVPTAAQKAAATQALLSRAVAAVRAKGSVETTSTYTENGQSATAVQWQGLTTASATVQVPGEGQVAVRVVGPAAYLVGDAGVLKSEGGIDPAAADLLGGKWLEIAQGDAGYEDMMANATLTSQKAQDWFSGTVTQLPTTTLNGQKVIPLRGAPSKDENAAPHSIATLYVAADGDPLPLKFEVTSATDHEVDVYGGWGTQQTVLSPPVAIDEAWLVNEAAREAAQPCGCASTSSIT
jgi:hypothetical protein